MYTSCTKDVCKEVICNNGGACAGGACSCPLGYESSTCANRTRDKFLGTWEGTNVCTSGSYMTSFSINASSDDLQVVVNNPGGLGTTVNIAGTVINSTTLSFRNADVGGNRILTGTMTFTGDSTAATKMQFSYNLLPATGPSDDACNGSYVRL